MHDIIKIKRVNSQDKIKVLSESLSTLNELKEIPHLSIFVAGSYAREEASVHSDIDLFFILDGELDGLENQNTKTLRAFTRIIEEVDKLGFPAFSNDGEYLEILEKPKMKRELGGRKDDHLNYFTARMLMLIEGKPIYGHNTFDEIVKDIVAAYFRDYTHHPRDFKPVFLINDIIRFWKTLCLNYEHKRNQPDENPDQKMKQKVKNFKLKFSRMMTCYGSIVSIISQTGNIGPEEVIRLNDQSPYDRLASVVRLRPELGSSFEGLSEEYNWFLEQTNVSGPDLLEAFRDKKYREEAFSRAERFGDAMFDITNQVAFDTGYLRYLLI